MNVHSSAGWRESRPHSPRAAHLVRALAGLALPLGLIAGCSDQGILEPAAPTGASAIAATPARAGVVVTADYSAFDARTDFANAGVAAHSTGFNEFSGELVYLLPTPWTSAGVTYTSALNIVLAPGLGLGVPSNSMSSEFGQAVTGTFAAGDAFTLFGADLTLIGVKVPVTVVVSTNVRSYSFANLDIPLATSGTRFFGVGLARPGEYLTGFSVSFVGASTAVLLDNVTVGHVAADVNTTPVASAGGPYAADEGSAMSLALGGSDADDDALTYTWDLGDGTTGTGPTPPASHVYVDEGSYDIALTVSDGRGGTHTAHATATIANVAPRVAAFALPATPLGLIAGGVSINVSTTFSDPGTADVHTAALDCGSGVSTQATTPHNGAASGTCTFSEAGVYSVRLTVQDDDGGTDTRAASGQVVVYDPAAGWVTGGGWIASPEGAYAAAPNFAGKLTFGFVARYEATGSTLSGNAEFKLMFGRLAFRSTRLDWLVLAGGTAHLRGRAMLNGAGDFEFALTAIDGSPDAIRIRVWDRLSGTVVYDSQPGTQAEDGAASPLGGGSIAKHAP